MRLCFVGLRLDFGWQGGRLDEKRQWARGRSSLAGHLTTKLRVLREENTAGVEVTRLRTKVVTRSSSQQRTCLSPPVLSSPPSHSFFPRTPRPALHQSPHSLRPMMVPVSTNRRILAGETHNIPIMREHGFPLPEKGDLRTSCNSGLWVPGRALQQRSTES